MGSKRKEQEPTDVPARKKPRNSLPPIQEKQGITHPALVTPTQDQTKRKVSKGGSKNGDTTAVAVPFTPTAVEPPNLVQTRPDITKGASKKVSKKSPTIQAHNKTSTVQEKAVDACNHEDLMGFENTCNRYFNKNWLVKTEGSFYPTGCSGNGCGKHFVYKSKANFDKVKQYKVTMHRKVHYCPNSDKKSHPCTFALCQDCYNSCHKVTGM